MYSIAKSGYPKVEGECRYFDMVHMYNEYLDKTKACLEVKQPNASLLKSFVSMESVGVRLPIQSEIVEYN